MIKLEVQAPTVALLRVELTSLLAGLGNEAPVADKGSSPPPVERAVKAEDASADKPSAPATTTGTAPKRRGRPPKSAATGSPAPVSEPAAVKEPEQAPLPLEAPAGAAEPIPSPVSAAPAHSFDDVKKKLAAVASRNGGKGLEDATAIIHSFNYVKIKDMQPEHFDAIAAKCDAFLGA